MIEPAPATSPSEAVAGDASAVTAVRRCSARIAMPAGGGLATWFGWTEGRLVAM